MPGHISDEFRVALEMARHLSSQRIVYDHTAGRTSRVDEAIASCLSRRELGTDQSLGYAMASVRHDTAVSVQWFL